MTSASTIAIWSQERIKAAADRAEARSRGETAEGYVESTAKVERLAKLSIFEFEQEREAAAEELGVRVRVLDEEVKRQRKKLGKSAKPTPRFDPDELERSASNIINHSDVLTLFAEAFNKVIAGEAVNGKLLYLVGTSRLFDKTMNAAIKGTSAGGKSEIRKRVLDFFPPEDVITFTSLSEKSLIYYDGDFTHKVLSMGEATATEEQDFQDYLLRELMSEGHIRHSTVQKVGNEMVATTIEKEGPVAFLVTTTKSKLHPENETRMLSLEIDDSEDQTKKVLDKVAQVDGLHDIAPVDYKPWQDFQRWLGLGECRVVVPFAGVMVKMIPAVAVRLRRDVGQVICAIKAHALIHRDQRDRNHAGRIVADIEHDYAAVRELMNAIVAEGSGVAVNPAMIETIKAVTTATVGMDDTEGANAKAVAKLLKLDRSAAWRRLSAACDEGYVVNLEQRERMPGKYRTTGQKAEPKVILPPTDDLAERYNTHLSLSPLESVSLSPLEFGAILCDPPWHFETWSPNGYGRHPSKHYDTMAAVDIRQLPVAGLAASDCVLFLWIIAEGIVARNVGKAIPPTRGNLNHAVRAECNSMLQVTNSFTVEDMRRFAGEAWGPLGVSIVERWCEFNATYFDNALHPVPLVISRTLPFGKRIAFCSYSPNANGRTITLNVPAQHNVLLADNGTLLHEMVHQCLFERGEDAAHLSNGWRREIMRLNKQITGCEIWAGPSVVRRIDGKSTRLNAPHANGTQSLTQAVVARWPHDEFGIHLGALGEV